MRRSSCATCGSSASSTAACACATERWRSSTCAWWAATCRRTAPTGYRSWVPSTSSSTTAASRPTSKKASSSTIWSPRPARWCACRSPARASPATARRAWTSTWRRRSCRSRRPAASASRSRARPSSPTDWTGCWSTRTTRRRRAGRRTWWCAAACRARTARTACGSTRTPTAATTCSPTIATANGGDGFRIDSETDAGTVVLGGCVAAGNAGHGLRAAAGNRSPLVSHCVFAGNRQGGVQSDVVPATVVGSIAWAPGRAVARRVGGRLGRRGRPPTTRSSSARKWASPPSSQRAASRSPWRTPPRSTPATTSSWPTTAWRSGWPPWRGTT